MEGGHRVERLLAGAVRAGLFPGAVAAWTFLDETPGTVHHVAVGRTAAGPEGRSTDPDTVYDLASLTKPLATTVLVLLAVREGRLGLDEPLESYLGETRGTWLAGVPLVRLLTHTSGLPAWVPLYAVAPEPGDWVRALIDFGPAYEPGSTVTYSCPGFLLLGVILERAMGETLDALFLRRVVHPLDLLGSIGYGLLPGRPVAGASLRPAAERAELERLGLDPATVPPGSRPDDGNARFLGGVAGNAGLFGTVDAVLRIASQFLSGAGDTLLDRSLRRLASENRTPGLEQHRALGWQLASSPGCSAGPALSPLALGHTGFTGTSVWIDPERGLAMVLLANRNHPVFRGTDLHPLRRRFHALAVRHGREESVRFGPS